MEGQEMEASRDRVIAVELKAVGKVYRRHGGKNASTDKTALTDLTVSIPAGQITGLLGPHGAGKTVLLKLIAGQLKPTSGSVRISGLEPICERAIMAQRIGSVLKTTQQARSSLWELLAQAGRLKSCPLALFEERARQLLHELDLWEDRYEPLRHVPPPVRLQVSLAGALLTDPDILLLDEQALALPVSMLKNWLEKLAHKQGKTVILATRQPAMAYELCAQALLLHEGRLVAVRPSAELRSLLNGEWYQIKVKGRLARRWSTWFGGLSMHIENGDTVLVGSLADQAELHGVLVKVRDLGLPLLSVHRTTPDLEDLFSTLGMGR
jgi:ABC-2 type transport system ATP-binding protein